jgi:chromate reductase, NAD(P)H dehydrogenase (quinone)
MEGDKEMTEIALISGSLRRDSVNATVIATVRDILSGRSDVRTTALDLRILPHYDQDAEDAGWPASVLAARELIEGCDALVVSTPSYNGTAPGVLKNALDWFSRPWGASPLSGMPAAVLSASPGPYGAADAQQNLCAVLERCGSTVVEQARLAIPKAAALPVLDGRFTDAATVLALEAAMDVLLAAVESAPPAKPLLAVG